MKLAFAIVACVAALVIAAGAASGASNPSQAGTGQPSQSCQAQPTGPPGLSSTTNGFATRAVNLYAGTQPQNSRNPHSVSHDVACFQVSQH
jgi:hypothetical protein